MQAGQYWLERYELVFSTRGTVDGATYTDVNVQLQALYLLMIISITAFVLFLVNIRRRGWVLPVIAVGLWAFVIVLAGETVPGVRAAVPGGAGRVVEGSDLHRAQHRGDTRTRST